MNHDSLPFVDEQLAPAWHDWRPHPISLADSDELLGLDRDQRKQLRRRMVAAAADYMRHLGEAVEAAGIAGDSLKRVATDAEQGADAPILLTGHQPVIFHPGLTFKYRTTARAAQDQRALAIAILMDTDPGDPGEFLVPQPTDESSDTNWPVASAQQNTFCGEATLYRTAGWRSPAELKATTDHVAGHLTGCGLVAATDSFLAAAHQYQRLVDLTPVAANVALRHLHGRTPAILELPLSSLCAFPEFQAALIHVARHSALWHQRYNELLDQWRDARKIRNPANPFPNLAREADRLELPLWLVDVAAGTRDRVWTNPSTGSNPPTLLTDREPLGPLDAGDLSDRIAGHTGRMLVPRGALVSLTFRLLCCDLFVHGLGGKIYDGFTDDLIRNNLGLEPPPFAVASASRYLFADARDELARLDQLNALQRDFVHRPEQFLGTGCFRVETEQRVHALWNEKLQCVQSLRLKKSAGESAADEGKRLHQIQAELKATVAAELKPALDRRTALTPAQRTAIECRTYPWFYWQ